MLERVRQAAVERGYEITTRQHTAEEMPYADGTFDLVTCRIAAHHFSSPQAFVAESARVLKPGGWFLLIDGSIDDDQREAEEWIHAVEILRDPSHHRFLTPHVWSNLCEQHGLNVRSAELVPFKQPDLEWYFDTAATSSQNRALVWQLIRDASAKVRDVFQLAEENGKTIWWWPRLTLIAEKVTRSDGRPRSAVDGV